MRLSATLLFAWIVLSCSSGNKTASQFSTKDSLVKEYLAQIDSLPYYDTTEENFRVLRAYNNNDTGFLKDLLIKNREYKKYANRYSIMDSCVHLVKLQDLHVDEAYRFIFYPAFCTMPIILTLSKRGESANLHFLLYQNAYDSVGCRIISNYDKELSTKEWDEFHSKLLDGDIWGLKRENGIHGNDGTNLTFIGYQSGNRWNLPEKIIYGNRWVYSSLKEALEFALVKSGNKQGCYWVQYK